VTTTKDVSFQVVDGIWHKTGNGGYVLIHPSESSAHYQGKHEDDVANVVTVTKTVLVTATPETCSTQTPAAQVSAGPVSAGQVNGAQAPANAAATGQATAPVVEVKAATVSQTAPGSAQGTSGQGTTVTPVSVQTPQGGVAGAQASLGKPKPSGGGVLGAVGNVAGASLPFTGFPLWIAVLVAIVLVGGGLMLSRRGRGDARL
jgi:hypothetical protein